ncbi:MAG: hypothetical protein J6A26_01850 [Oscillospiraceae bacterium]|nr:hypothetical protein [Oscillospiraceae bacterium]
MKDKYTYMVSYFHKNGVGQQTITAKKKIRSVSDLRLIEAFIARDGTEDVIITNFILLDTKWGVWEWLVSIGELVMLVLCILAIIASFFG